jgi:hypothetical protein
MKWLSITLIFFVQTLLPARESKPIFRALIACDITSKNIHKGSHADLVRMKKSCIAIAKQLGISSKLTVLQGKRFAAKNITKWIANIPSHSKDIIFFYYSGHGGRSPSLQDPWPFMVFPLKKNPHKAQSLLGGTVYRNLRQKNPRLSIIIFDSCNNIIRRKGPELLSQSIFPIITQHPALPGLKKLFLNTRGMITSCAAKPGETALTTVRGKVIGGVFTTGLLLSIKYFANQPNTNWNNIFSGASLYCHKHYPGRQHPIYVIETSNKGTVQSPRKLIN